MNFDNKKHPDGPSGFKCLVWKRGILWVETACLGKKLRFSTGTTDPQEALRQLRAAQAKARVEAGALTKTEYSPAIREMLSLPEQDAVPSGGKPNPSLTGTEPDAGETTSLRQQHWEMCVRGMVDSYKSGQGLATAAATFGVRGESAFRWMAKHRYAWITEMLERK